jgi:hypothetical protein
VDRPADEARPTSASEAHALVGSAVSNYLPPGSSIPAGRIIREILVQLVMRGVFSRRDIEQIVYAADVPLGTKSSIREGS